MLASADTSTLAGAMPGLAHPPKRSIRRVAVLGSGVMGSRIACHLANAGLEVLLLDIVPMGEAPAGMADKPAYRNSVAQKALEAAIKSNPAPLFTASYARRIRVGNLEDNLAEIARYDWIIEVVVENLKIKQALLEKVDALRKPGTLISSNTSGIPIHLMTEGRSDDFRRHFLGTHFFNPPRYLPLLEIIPTTETDPSVTQFFLEFGDRILGKTTVLAQDTPAFIANRIGVFAILDVLRIMDEQSLTIEQVDKLTGPVIGHPKSATFRTGDVVGLDVLIKVADGLAAGLPNDERNALFQLPEYLRKMEANKWLGDKTGQGFYKKLPTKEILVLDPKTLEYRAQEKAKFATLEATKSIESLSKRWSALLAGQDAAGAFYRRMLGGLFAYVSHRLGEITPDLYRIDDGLRAGFGWEEGPFETWDAVGIARGAELAKAAGFPVADWVNQALAAGITSFYKAENGKRLYYDAPTRAYKVIPGQEGQIRLANLVGTTSEIWSNSGATLYDIGDGVACLEFHTKMNTLGSEVIEGIQKSITRAEKEFAGLVIGNQGPNFSAGANLALVFMYAVEEDWDELDLMIRQFQQTMMRVRYSAAPIVVAPHGLTLGGGCEMTMHADAVVAAAETYIGLVEVGVGVIPGGGGTKETALRVSDSFQAGDPEINALTNAFMNIAQAKVATSAREAFDMNILRHGDIVSMNKARQIADAKIKVLELAEAGYVQPTPRTDIRVLGKSALGTIYAGIEGMHLGRYISDHDKKVVQKLAQVICGGELSYPQQVSEQYLLDLEREAFLSLCGERKTLVRIQAVLQTGRPVRN